jgi:hypothetical protein
VFDSGVGRRWPLAGFAKPVLDQWVGIVAFQNLMIAPILLDRVEKREPRGIADYCLHDGILRRAAPGGNDGFKKMSQHAILSYGATLSSIGERRFGAIFFTYCIAWLWALLSRQHLYAREPSVLTGTLMTLLSVPVPRRSLMRARQE